MIAFKSEINLKSFTNFNKRIENVSRLYYYNIVKYKNSVNTFWFIKIRK